MSQGCEMDSLYDEESVESPNDGWDDYDKERQTKNRGDHRRRIERYMELKRLREMIGEDSSFDDDELSTWNRR